MNPRTYWFDALDFDLVKDQKVVVKTVRGMELATVADEVFEPDDDQVSKLKSPLKPIVRIATDADIDMAREMEQLGAEAMPVFRQLVEETKLDMRPVSVEYLLDGDKAIFYFESEERIDFRDLVRKLASHFHVRVDMRQIGVRDEARMIGGLGHCGQELCCARMGGDFNPVSIRMAKEQDLSLNPQKISGTCGRLMCCLRYEYDAYKDFNSRAPKKNATIQTPEGPAKVTSLDVPRELVVLKVEGDSDKTVKVPLSAFDEPVQTEGKDRVRPHSIGQEAWDEVLSQEDIRSSIDGIFLTSQFTQVDKVGSGKAIHNERKSKEQGEKKSGRSRRGRKQDDAASPAAGATAPKPSASDARKRRRRSTKISADTASSARDAARASNARGNEAHAGHGSETGGSSAEKNASGRVRPGQRSSGLRGAQPTASVRDAEHGASSDAEKKGRSSNRRRSPRKKQGEAGAQGTPRSRSAAADSQRNRSNRPDGQTREAGSENTQASAHRRSRRRSHKANGSADAGAASE